MPRRKKSNDPALSNGVSGINTLGNVTNFQNQIMTRSRRKALEMLPSSNIKEIESGPVKKTKQLRSGSKGAPKKNAPNKKDAQGGPKEPESPAGGASPDESSQECRAVGQSTLNREDELVLEQYKGMRRLLGTKSLDVVDRLKLDYTPRCTQERSFCRSHHWETCAPVPLAEEDLKSKAMHLLGEERYPHFIKFVEDMCLRNEFPGPDIITRIWELVLTVHVPDYENYTSIWVVDECVFLFEKIISKFPPCWIAIRESYSKLLTVPINAKNILPNRNASAQNILEFVIFQLSETIKEEPKQELDELKEEIFNFHEWEKKNMPKRDFEAISREQRLDRLFVVLHQVTKVLEMDLAIWIFRHIGNTKDFILGAEKPLICSVFGFDQYTHITLLVKRTLEVYVKCVCFSYPPNQTAHITRLVSLLAVVINLRERSTTKGLKYPNIGQVTKEFVKEIYKVIDGLVGKSIEHILMVIKSTKVPFVKYLLIDDLLFKLDGSRQEMSAKKVIDIFRKQSWLEYELSDEKIQIPTRSVENLKYPVIPEKISNRKSAVIYRDVYLNLLLMGLKAYCDFYAIKDIAKLFAQKKPNEGPVFENKRLRKMVVCSTSEEMDFSRMEDDIDALVDRMDLKKELPSQPEEIPCFEGIHVDANVMKQYRNELKCLLIMRKNIPVLREKHGRIFDEFYDFTQKGIFGDD